MSFHSEASRALARPPAGVLLEGAYAPARRVDAIAAAAAATAGHVGRLPAIDPTDWLVDDGQPAVLVATPEGRDALTDPRYYIKLQVAPQNLEAEALLEPIDDLRPDEANRIVVATNFAELRNGSHLLQAGAVVWVRRIVTETGPHWWFAEAPPATFLAKITGHVARTTIYVAIAGGSLDAVEIAWAYAWHEVQRSGDGVAAVSGGRSGTTTAGYAINVLELGHDGIAFGVDMTGASYPVGFRPRPVGAAGSSNTHAQDITVNMTERLDAAGAKVYDFQQLWTHDGGCSL